MDTFKTMADKYDALRLVQMKTEQENRSLKMKVAELERVQDTSRAQNTSEAQDPSQTQDPNQAPETSGLSLEEKFLVAAWQEGHNQGFESGVVAGCQLVRDQDSPVYQAGIEAGKEAMRQTALDEAQEFVNQELNEVGLIEFHRAIAMMSKPDPEHKARADKIADLMCKHSPEIKNGISIEDVLAGTRLHPLVQRKSYMCISLPGKMHPLAPHWHYY
jgi:hypothetical protein